MMSKILIFVLQTLKIVKKLTIDGGIAYTSEDSVSTLAGQFMHYLIQYAMKRIIFKHDEVMFLDYKIHDYFLVDFSITKTKLPS